MADQREPKVTVLPPGKAPGADDLQKWARRRNVGASGVPDKLSEKIDADRRKAWKTQIPKWKKRLKKADREAAKKWEVDRVAAMRSTQSKLGRIEDARRRRAYRESQFLGERMARDKDGQR